MPSKTAGSAGVGLIILASIFFGISGVFAKSLFAVGITPLQVTWLRVAGVGVLLLIVALPVLKQIRHAPLGAIIAFGLAAVAGVQGFYFLAVARLPVGIALLLEFTGPVLVVAWVRWVRRTRLPRPAVVGALVSLAGLCIVIEVWSGLSLDLWGLAAGAGAAACQAGYFLGGESLASRVNVRLLLAVGFGVGTLALTPMAAPWTIEWHRLAVDTTLAGTAVPAYGTVLVLIACTAAAYATGLPALRILSAPVAGGMGYTEVVVASIGAWLLLGEWLTTWQIVGGIVVIAGVATTQRAVATHKVDGEAGALLPDLPDTEQR
ncbi:MAG TPA: EamA family transporter [Candidatus Stackebrandtia faecavium]|nr:EamA family transporter [Candidatus Stackebrandtia faecavium]